MSPELIVRRSEPQASCVFDTYWRFAAERQRIFFHRLAGAPPPWTDDPILRQYKFTNAYRASDRVSQYLIRHVIYDADREFADTFVRILLFKIFNRIETWEAIQSEVGEVCAGTFDVHRFGRILDRQMRLGKRIYSAAYIMPTGGLRVPKHETHLALVHTMLREGVPSAIERARSMKDAFELLLAYRTVGPFLAYQWATDLNYSPHLAFDEMEFVTPGPGSRDGLAKCFTCLNGWSESDVIRWVADTQSRHFARLGIRFESLWDRPLQLIDCQNLFCEVDKYARIRHPEVAGRSGRQRIKQIFRGPSPPIQYFYPPKWRLQVPKGESPGKSP